MQREHVLSWAHRSWRAMGSTAEVLIWAEEPEDLAEWAVAEVERLERCWSRFDPSSELSDLNLSGGIPVVVSDLLWSAISKAHDGWVDTGGLFDPTVLHALIGAGYDRTFREITIDGPGPLEATPAPGFASVLLDAAQHTVVVPVGIGIDLGGIGKGLAADIIATGLLERGAVTSNVSFGGDIRVAGPGPDEDGSWLVTVEDPFDDSVLVKFPLINEAIVQSTRLFRQWERNGAPMHHLIDPRTGLPSTSGIAAVVVTGPEAWRSEVFAKAALIAGPAQAIAMLEAADLDGWVITDDHTVMTTQYVGE